MQIKYKNEKLDNLPLQFLLDVFPWEAYFRFHNIRSQVDTLVLRWKSRSIPVGLLSIRYSYSIISNEYHMIRNLLSLPSVD